MHTSRDTVRLLCKSIITRLENDKAITFPPRLRQVVQDEVYGLIGPYILTEEDLRDKTLARIGAKADELEGSEYSDSDRYKAAKAVIKGTFGDDELNGLYFQKPMKEVAKSVAGYMMRSSHIDDVFESDDALEKQVVDTIKKFDAANVH